VLVLLHAAPPTAWRALPQWLASIAWPLLAREHLSGILRVKAPSPAGCSPAALMATAVAGGRARLTALKIGRWRSAAGS
jgi:hypothetical protein